MMRHNYDHKQPNLLKAIRKNTFSGNTIDSSRVSNMLKCKAGKAFIFWHSAEETLVFVLRVGTLKSLLLIKCNALHRMTIRHFSESFPLKVHRQLCIPQANDPCCI